MFRTIVVNLIFLYLITQSALVGARWQSIAYPTKDVIVYLAEKDELGKNKTLKGDLTTNWLGDTILLTKDGDIIIKNYSSMVMQASNSVRTPWRVFLPLVIIFIVWMICLSFVLKKRAKND